MRILNLILLSTIWLVSSVDIDKLVAGAKSGDVESITQLAYIYENGVDVKTDIIKAKKLYKKASSLGSEDAELSLTLLDLKNKVEKSVSIKNSVATKDKESLFTDIGVDDIGNMITKAKKGDKDALFSLAVMYDNGYGAIEPNKKRAISLYKKAYENGSIKAKEVLELLEK